MIPRRLRAALSSSPGLFIAGFALRSEILGRVLALVGLVRSGADFLVASIALCAIVYLAGSVRLPRPQIDDWLHRGQVAICSPPLGARLRARPATPTP